jgi:hypothetical protein
MTQSSTTAASLLQQYKDAGLDYTGIAEYSDVSKFSSGTNDYVLKAHVPIEVICEGMKPLTRVWPRFDGRDVSGYCGPSRHEDYGTALMTDVSGNLTFWFKIPNDNTMKFKGYKHLLEVSDAKPPVGNGISSGKIGATTRCGQYYYAPANISGMSGIPPGNQTTQIALTEITADSSQTVVSVKQVTDEIPDYLSQTFVVTKGTDGVYLDDVKLWFAKKPGNSNASITVQIRQVDSSGKPTDVLVAQSARVSQGNVNVSSTAAQAAATTFTFPSGVFLKKNSSYALTVIPNEDGNDFEIWSAVKNSNDVSSDISAYVVPELKTLFGSATGNQWAQLPNEFLKCEITYKKFSTLVELGGTKTTFQFENKDLDFLNVSAISPVGGSTHNSGFQMSETIRGECSMQIANNQTISVGDVLQSRTAALGGAITAANYAIGTVRSVGAYTGGNLTISIDSFKDFSTTATANTNNVYFGSGALSGSWCGNTVIFSDSSAPTGRLVFLNGDFGRIRLEESDGGFVANKYIRGQEFGASAKIDAIIDPKIDSVDINTVFEIPQGTVLSWDIKATSVTGSLDSVWKPITGSTRVDFEQDQKRIYSKSNSANKSLLIRGTMYTSDSTVSPTVDIDDVTVNASRQRLNSVSTNETFPAGGALARYVSKVVRATSGVIGEASERLNIVTQAYFPVESGIELYIRAKNDNDSEPLSDKNFTQMSLYKTTPSQNSTLGNRRDQVYLHHRFSANTDGDNFLGLSNIIRENSGNNGVIAYRSGDGSVHHGVDEYQLKIVFTRPDGKGTSYSPEVSAVTVTAHKSPLNIV